MQSKSLSVSMKAWRVRMFLIALALLLFCAGAWCLGTNATKATENVVWGVAVPLVVILTLCLAPNRVMARTHDEIIGKRD
jgi:hypothetical protein